MGYYCELLSSCSWRYTHVLESDPAGSPGECNSASHCTRSQAWPGAVRRTPRVDFPFSLLKCGTWLEPGLELSSSAVASREETP